MGNDFIRLANEQDLNLITEYFKRALAHYEETGELLAIQDIKYFLQNMHSFHFIVKKETKTEITYIFEFPETTDNKRETGVIAIPLQNN